MAYRTFENEKYYAQPEIDFFPKTLAIIQAAQQAKQRQQQQNRQLAATYQADKLASNFTTDQELLNQISAKNTQMAVGDFITHGNLTPATRQELSKAMGYKQLSDSQWKMKEDLEKIINDRVIRGPNAEKNYYDKSADQQKLIDAAYGKENEPVSWANRAERMNSISSTIGKDYINGFNKEAFIKDYVDELKTTLRENQSKNQNGIKVGSKVSAVFRDENGVPKVTDKHAIEFLDSSPHVRERYRQEVNAELMDDARKMMATKEGEYLKSMSPDQIITLFRENPSANKIAQIKPGERERDLARKDLERRQRINLENSYDASDVKDSSGAGITNDKIAHSYAFHSGNFSGPGGVLPMKTGKYFSIASSSPDRTDMSSGKTSHAMKGQRSMAVEGYRHVPTWSDGRPLDIKVNSIDEWINTIKNLPDHYFDPNSKQHLTGLKLGLVGTTIDKAGIIQKSFAEEKNITKQIAEAEQNNDTARKEALTQKLNSVKKLKQLAGKDELTPEEEDDFQYLLPYSGFSGIEYNELVLANPQDTKTVKAVTGMDPSNPSSWDEDTKRAYEAFDQKRKEAQANGYGKSELKQKKGKAYKENVSRIQKKIGINDQSEEVEQDGNIFQLDPSTGQYKFVRKK